ncbi:MAG TPA: TIM-barrel domain-containing protein [Candidatus Dormibacteraeota bacterium]|jgi:alpha-glucosidase|nr:TIM-barrel domain-containing protein [Candidatus Dormibacteraeota bacterium]
MPLINAPRIRDCNAGAATVAPTVFEKLVRALHHRFALLSMVLGFLLAASASLRGQVASVDTAVIQLNHLTSSFAMPNGIEVRDGDARMQIVALREEVVRVRVSRSKELPEDASWAVLMEARESRVAVAPDDTPSAVGFRTQALRVSVDRKTFALTIADLGGNILQEDVRPIEFHGDSFSLYKAMPPDEHYFGLGDKPGPLDRRGEAFTMWNTDAYGFQESTDPIYKSIPYFMAFRAGRALGVFFDNTWRSSFDFGKQLPDTYSFGAVDGPLDYYVFYGPTPKHVVETYAWLTGTISLPPIWSLGFQQSRYSYTPQSRVMEIAEHLRADHIPADVIYLDIDFQQQHRPFTLDQKTFPDLPGLISQLASKNFHVVAITDLHIANYPGHGYAPYDTGIAGDHFVKSRDGSVYLGSVWPGPSAFPDFTRAKTRDWWGGLYREFSEMGIAGFWNDMNEPSVFNSPTKTMPEDVIHRIDESGFMKRSATHAEIHNVYGMENSRATFEGLQHLNSDFRPFVLTRATYAGGQRYGATWTGDNSSTWNHLRLTTPMLENLGISGFALSGADVGGYAGTPQQDLLTKWIEIASFQPIDRDHTEKGTGDQEPWVGGPEPESIRRRFIEERYRLMPYLYTLAEEASRTGLPIERPLFLEFPDAASDHHPIDVDPQAAGEFLLGPEILIAAPPYPDKLDNYVVEFPSAKWYDYWTGQPVSKPAPSDDPDPNAPPSPTDLVPLTTWVHPELASLPIFVHAGAILPIAPLVQSTNETPHGPLTLRVYAGDNCAGHLYLDDGKTYAYKTGASLQMDFRCEVSADRMVLRLGRHEGSYPAWWQEIHVEIYGWSPKNRRVHLKRESIDTAVDLSTTRVALTIPDDGKGEVVELQ